MSVQIGIGGIRITRIGLIRMSFRRTPVFEERYFTAIVGRMKRTCMDGSC